MGSTAKPIADILVTGSSSGIGLAVCQTLLAANYRVIGIARRTAAIPSEHYTHIALDLADIPFLPEKLAELARRYSNLQGLVACAGSGRFGSLEEFSTAQIQQSLELNLLSPIMLTHALLPQLKKQKHADIVFIGSEAALQGGKQGTLYCASKFGLRGFSQALRQDCAGSNVRVALINAGMVKTAFFDKLKFRPGDSHSNAIAADDIANLVLAILETRAGTVIDEINLSPHKKVIEFNR